MAMMATALLFIATTTTTTTTTKPQPPHIVTLIVDDLGHGNVGWLREEAGLPPTPEVQTPNMVGDFRTTSQWFPAIPPTQSPLPRLHHATAVAVIARSCPCSPAHVNLGVAGRAREGRASVEPTL